jgi:hypothetical protein
MGRDLIGLKKKSRLGGALPEAGRKDGQDKGGSPSRTKDTRSGKEINPFCLSRSSVSVPVSFYGRCLVRQGSMVEICHQPERRKRV